MIETHVRPSPHLPIFHPALVRYSNAMTHEDAARRIFGERSTFYSRSAVHKDPEVLKRVVELANPKPDSLALDVAPGSGHTAAALAPNVASVVCADITPQMIRKARKLSFAQGLGNMRFCLTDALREIRRVLQPNGILVVDDRSVPEDDFVD